MNIHTDFAMAVAAYLETTVIMEESHAFIFDDKVMRWTTSGLRLLEKTITACLHKIFGWGSIGMRHGSPTRSP
eukprot:4680212-Karenia_brevis.AAC.1